MVSLAITTLMSILFVTVISTTPAMSASSQETLSDRIQALFERMSGHILQQEKNWKVAIVDFTRLDGAPHRFGQYLAERLITTAVRTGSFEVLERRQLDKILNELRLALSDLMDARNTKRLGKLYAVDAIITGTVVELAGEFEVNARVVDTTTGSILGASAMRFLKDNELMELIGLEGSTARSRTGQPSSGRRAGELLRALDRAVNHHRYNFGHESTIESIETPVGTEEVLLRQANSLSVDKSVFIEFSASLIRVVGKKREFPFDFRAIQMVETVASALIIKLRTGERVRIVFTSETALAEANRILGQLLDLN